MSQRRVSQIVPLSKFPGVTEKQSYVVRSHTSGQVSNAMTTEDSNALFHISLDVRGYDILTSYPVTGFVGAKFRNTYIANLGLVDKMSGAAAIVGNKITELENGRVLIDTNLKALGTLGIFLSGSSYI